MKPEFQMHQIDVGPQLDQEEIAHRIAEAKGHPAVTAFLQLLRNQAAMIDKTGRQPPASAVPSDYRAYHDGGADALEEVFWIAKTFLDPKPAPDQ